MRGRRNDGKPIVRKGLPKKRKNVEIEPIPGSIGALLRKERIARDISQQTIADKLAKISGGKPYNGRVSQIELGKSLPNDKELGIFSNAYGLSAATLRAKRDASTSRPWPKKNKNKNKDKIAVINAPKPTARLAAKTVAASPAAPDPAGVPVIADWIGLIDGIVRMPVDPGERKRWFAAVMELFALRSRNGGT